MSEVMVEKRRVFLPNVKEILIQLCITMVELNKQARKKREDTYDLGVFLWRARHILEIRIEELRGNPRRACEAR